MTSGTRRLSTTQEGKEGNTHALSPFWSLSPQVRERSTPCLVFIIYLGNCRTPLFYAAPPAFLDSYFVMLLMLQTWWFISCYFCLFSPWELLTPAFLILQSCIFAILFLFFIFYWAYGSYPLTHFWSCNQVDILWPCYLSASSFVVPWNFHALLTS